MPATKLSVAMPATMPATCQLHCGLPATMPATCQLHCGLPATMPATLWTASYSMFASRCQLPHAKIASYLASYLANYFLRRHMVIRRAARLARSKE